MNLRKISPFVIVFLLLAGCSQPAPLTLAQIPLYEGSKILSENDVLAEPLAESLRQSTGIDDMDAELLVVNLTGDSSWARIKNFYNTFMVGMQWELSEEYEKDENHVKVSGWTQGGWSPDQVLLVSEMSDPLGGSPYLMFILFSK